MKNIAIVGGHGFIGKNFCDFFLSLGYKVTLVGRNSGKREFPSTVNSVDARVSDVAAICAAVKDSSCVIWLASSLIPGSHEASLELDFDSNIRPVIAYLQKADNGILKKFVYLSSGGTVYGNPSQPIPFREDDDTHPISEYGLSKLITENYIKFITQKSTFESYILRPSNVYGKYQNLNKPQGIIGFAFKSLINQSAIELYGDGKVIRDFVHVKDVAKAVLKCIDAPHLPSATHLFNVGNGQPFSIREIIDKISTITGMQVRTISRPARNFDCDYNVLSISKITNNLNWVPLMDIDHGLMEVWDWIKQQEDA